MPGEESVLKCVNERPLGVGGQVLVVGRHGGQHRVDVVVELGPGEARSRSDVDQALWVRGVVVRQPDQRQHKLLDPFAVPEAKKVITTLLLVNSMDTMREVQN